MPPFLRSASLVVLVVLVRACRKTPLESAANSDRQAPSTSGTPQPRDRRDSVADEIATAERRSLLTNDICAAHLRERRIARATFPSGEARLAGPEADAWRRPSTIQCELCGTPVRDGDTIVGRIAIVNTGSTEAKVYLQSATHGPLWLETVPPAPPPPPPPTPLPEVYPAAMVWSIPAGSALDAQGQADVSAEALRRGGTVVVRASVVFWNGGGEPCGDATVPL